MSKSLVLQNKLGTVVRVFPWESPERVFAVFRRDTKRLEVLNTLTHLKKKEVPFDIVCEGKGSDLQKSSMQLGEFGSLVLVDARQINPTLTEANEDGSKNIKIASVLALVAYLLVGFLLTDVFAPSQELAQEIPEEKKREIVKVVKRKISIPKVQKRTVSLNQPTQPQKLVQKQSVKQGWKRRGALAALGQLKNSKQKGGLDLGAVKATAGPGMGGSQGSGGVQTSIYSKGMVAAPLGAGHNIKGGGGYGTKGKGGGKAGFGSVSLIGATGASLIPIPEEATVDGGLDGSLIADVVRRNIGQIRFCYEQGLQLNASLSGRVSVNWVIDGSGRVKVANVKNTSLNNKTVEDCILRRLRTWKFPIPAGNQEVPVSYPFLLKRTGRG